MAKFHDLPVHSPAPAPATNAPIFHLPFFTSPNPPRHSNPFCPSTKTREEKPVPPQPPLPTPQNLNPQISDPPTSPRCKSRQHTFHFPNHPARIPQRFRTAQRNNTKVPSPAKFNPTGTSATASPHNIPLPTAPAKPPQPGILRKQPNQSARTRSTSPQAPFQQLPNQPINAPFRALPGRQTLRSSFGASQYVFVLQQTDSSKRYFSKHRTNQEIERKKAKTTLLARTTRRPLSDDHLYGGKPER